MALHLELLQRHELLRAAPTLFQELFQLAVEELCPWRAVHRSSVAESVRTLKPAGAVTRSTALRPN
jgi:hypothetical protein